jgi:DNA-binding transcriptional regulator of glucitol operon
VKFIKSLRSTLILLMWRIWRAANNASRWQMGFNSAFEMLSWCGRVERKNKKRIPKQMVAARVEGIRKMERPWKRWTDDV